MLLCSVLGVAATSSQAPGLRPVMRQKLTHAQKILAAVVTSDWGALESESLALVALTKVPAWAVLTSPEYGQHSAEFRQAIRDLHQAAARHDLEETPQAYNTVIRRCVECHRYIARARQAKGR
ncbi:MAG: hypothetical protein ABIX28_26410 [Vicinamibacterales bacterium]